MEGPPCGAACPWAVAVALSVAAVGMVGVLRTISCVSVMPNLKVHQGVMAVVWLILTFIQALAALAGTVAPPYGVAYPRAATGGRAHTTALSPMAVTVAMRQKI